MLQYAKFLAAAAALALAPAAFAQAGHAHSGAEPAAQATAFDSHHDAARHADRHDADRRGGDRHDLDRRAYRHDASYRDNRHRGWTQGHHYGWDRHGRHHRPGAMTHAYYSRHDRYRHHRHYVEHRHDRDHDHV